MGTFTESTVEAAALAWLESLGWQVKHGLEIAPGELFAERQDYGQVVLEQRLRKALVRLNRNLSKEALQEAFRKVTHPEGANLVQRNRHFHRMLVDGVTVEYRRSDGSIAGAQAWVVDFAHPENNNSSTTRHWLSPMGWKPVWEQSPRIATASCPGVRSVAKP